MKKIIVFIMCIVFASCSTSRFVNYSLLYNSTEHEEEKLKTIYSSLPYLVDVDSRIFVEKIELIENRALFSEINAIGTTDLICVVDEKSQIESIFVSRSIDPILDSLCLKSILASKFNPYIEDGKLKKYSFKIRYPFSANRSYPPNINYNIFNYGIYTDPNKDNHKVINFNMLDTKAKISYKPHPTYPDKATNAGIEGTVVVTVIINEEGSVIDATLFRSVHPILDLKSINSSYKCKFEPGYVNGKKVKTLMNIPYSFKNP